MGFTPEQKAAQQALQEAIVRHTEAFKPGSRDLPEMVADWALVVNVVSYSKDGERLSAYNMAYSDGEMDEHRAAGLMRVGEKIALGDPSTMADG